MLKPPKSHNHTELTKSPQFARIVGYLIRRSRSREGGNPIILVFKSLHYMSFAVFATGGKQYLVAKGDKIQVEKLEGEAGDKVTFDQVLATISEKDAELGKPVLTGKSVEATIVKQGRGKKIEVLKYKPKSKYRRKIGHRQSFTEIEITKI